MFDPNPIPAGLTRSHIIRSPTVVHSPNDTQGYSYGTPTTPTSSGISGGGGGWFSGLRHKISQLTGMSEWLTQLGIGNPNEHTMRPSMSQSAVSSSSHQNSPPSPSTVHRSQSMIPGEGYSDDTGFSFDSITLEDCPTDYNNKGLDLGWMDFSSRDWCDTLERQHFGPLKDLITIGGNNKGKGHEFVPLNVVHPTWCDKCGDFILFGFVKQSVKCKKCNYTCHDRCEMLVTLDCRSTNSSCDSQEFVSLYPKLDDRTLGTIPKGTVLPELPDIPKGEKTTDSDKENGTFHQTNPLFQSNSFTLPRNFAPLCENVNNPEAYRIEEVYIKEDTPFEFPHSSADSIERAIEGYNREAEGLGMNMCSDGDSFTGYLHIHMNFTRPINIVAGEQPPTMYDVVNTGKNTMSTLRTITSFFLPRHTVKTVNITSQMTTRQMIVTLLKKFRVADNPRKFALYECEHDMDREKNTMIRRLTRISDEACPLKVALQWGSPQCGKAFVLQENDTGDILWDAFEIPELENFLRILAMEEQQYNYQIRQKYNSYRRYLDQELRNRGQTVEDRASAPPMETAPPPPPVDYYGTSDSMVFHTVKEGDISKDPIYMNLSFLQDNNMDQSTRL